MLHVNKEHKFQSIKDISTEGQNSDTHLSLKRKNSEEHEVVRKLCRTFNVENINNRRGSNLGLQGDYEHITTEKNLSPCQEAMNIENVADNNDEAILYTETENSNKLETSRHSYSIVPQQIGNERFQNEDEMTEKNLMPDNNSEANTQDIVNDLIDAIVNNDSNSNENSLDNSSGSIIKINGSNNNQEPLDNNALSSTVKENGCNNSQEPGNNISSSSTKTNDSNLEPPDNNSLNSNSNVNIYEDNQELQDNNASTSTTNDSNLNQKDNNVTNTGTKVNVGKVRRDKCRYGHKCYRKCPKHKMEFSHPKDSDYDTDPNDTRIECTYGLNCYRKSKTHKEKYKHPTPRYFRKRKARAPQQYSSDDDEEIDPFIDDDSEDDYESDSDSEFDSDSDSEYSDSQKY